ncbi:hypothetical protein T484DRAFT_1934562 [Baffinella frigidus]|nr:hypothetical protein T484DRAFT_1934562 [Cryptophyta sp. CCMP2293]
MRCDVVAAAGAAAAGLQPPPAETPSPISSRVPSGLSSASRAPSGLSEKSRAPSELSSGLSEKSLASTEEAGLFGAAEDGKATVKEKLWARLGGEGALLAVALSAAMSGFAQPRALTLSDPVPGHSSVTASAYSVRVRDALAALGAPVMLQDVEAPLHASLAMVGGGGGITLLVPRVSWGCAACGVSPAVTGAITASAAVVVDACRAVAVSSKVEGVELCGALLHFLSKEAPSRLEPYLDSDVIALAHFWLVSPESARATAHALLSARLGRTQPATRQAIVTEWTAKLNERAAVVGPAPAGLAGPEGPAVIVLAVIGSHFVDSLNTATAARVAKALVAALSSAILLHSKAASHLLARGAALWCRHLTDPLALLRTLYTRYWRWQDFGTTMQEAEFALRSVAPILPSEFVEVIGEEASRHSQLVCHVRSERSVTAIRVLVAMIKRHPLPMLPALPRAVEVVLSTLDPAHPLVRQALMQHSTAALKEIVRRFPQATFHQETQRFAVGTVDALVVIFDVRTATKWRVLEGHEGAISAVTFDGAGQRLATFSAAEGRVRFWETGHSGPFGLFSSKVGRCVQQFTVPHAELRVADKAGAALAFGILFTPNAIVLTRDSVPICEFPIK